LLALDRRDLAIRLAKLGAASAIKMAKMEMTTMDSMSVKPLARGMRTAAFEKQNGLLFMRGSVPFGEVGVMVGLTNGNGNRTSG
jgi:hypothetical protein